MNDPLPVTTIDAIKLVMNYLLIPLGVYMLRELRMLAEAMHKLDVRVSVVESTVGHARRTTDPQEN